MKVPVNNLKENSRCRYLVLTSQIKLLVCFFTQSPYFSFHVNEKFRIEMMEFRYTMQFAELYLRLGLTLVSYEMIIMNTL